MVQDDEKVICYQGAIKQEKNVEEVRKNISQALQMENLSVLMGAGCSSFYIDKKEAAISTMTGLFNYFIELHPDLKILGVDISR